MVTSPSRVITSSMRRSMSRWNRRSRLVTMPIKPAPGVHHRNAADLVLLHQGEGVAHGVVLGDGDRIVDHAVLGALHAAHLRGLLGDRHVFVDDADAPSRASAMASGASVTVSIAAETMGILSLILREKRVSRETSRGNTSEKAGTSSTSSNVSPSGCTLSLINDIMNVDYCCSQK